MSAATEIQRLHAIVDPIASDLRLDVYDIERRGGTIRVTLDSPRPDPRRASTSTSSRSRPG